MAKHLTSIELPNKTPEDAFRRVVYAKMGSFVNASDDYLLALDHELHVWSQEIQQEMQRRIEETNKRHEAMSDEF